MANYDDEITRACARCGVRSGSALERDTRQAIWNIAGNDFSEPTRSQRIDKFLNESKLSPYYADSLVESPKAPEEKDLDLHALTVDQHTHIARHGLGDAKKKTEAAEKPVDVLTLASAEELQEMGRSGLK